MVSTRVKQIIISTMIIIMIIQHLFMRVWAGPIGLTIALMGIWITALGYLFYLIYPIVKDTDSMTRARHMREKLVNRIWFVITKRRGWVPVVGYEMFFLSWILIVLLNSF